MRMTAMILNLILLMPSAWYQGVPSARPGIDPPKEAKLVLLAYAKGDQIYTCTEQNGQYSWTLKAPEAQLLDKKGKVLGRHFKGPSWELSDKSAVTGRMIAHVDAPRKNAIPWLLVEVVGHSGEIGQLSSVTYIQRINTKRGKAPARGCASSSGGKDVRSPYSATYRFYETKPN